MLIDEMQRIVVKIGSSSLVDFDTNSIFTDRLDSIAQDISWLSNELRKEIILMSSGALAWGRIRMSVVNIDTDCFESQQVAGACGQIGIASAWSASFHKYEMVIGQLLLAPESVSTKVVRGSILSMLRNGIVPYINENIPTLEAYDNDGLAAEVAREFECDTLIFLSDVDGVYSANPMTDPTAVKIPEIVNIEEAINEFGAGASSSLGTGGMVTKLRAAKLVSTSGIDTIISSGEELNPLRALATGGIGTIIRRRNPLANAQSHH